MHNHVIYIANILPTVELLSHSLFLYVNSGVQYVLKLCIFPVIISVSEGVPSHKNSVS